MKNIYWLITIVVMICAPMAAAEQSTEGFVSLFNGKNLDGWVNINCAPQTWQVNDGIIVCSGIPTGLLRTEKQYENFILELDWRHTREGGNAGVFIHSGAVPAPANTATANATGASPSKPSLTDIDTPHPPLWYHKSGGGKERKHVYGLLLRDLRR